MVTIPRYVAPGTPIETMISEAFIKLLRKNTVGNLKFYINDTMENQTLYFGAGSKVTFDPPIYIGLLDDKYSVYLGDHGASIYNILLDKEVSPDTHDVTVRVTFEHGQFKERTLTFYEVVPVVKHKEIMKW